MDKTLWQLISESKGGNKYVGSARQYKILLNILSNLREDNVKKIEEEWRNKVMEIIYTPEFEKLHINNGGIINSGDDGFYMDFANWIIAQGEDLYNSFKNKGHIAIFDYIKEYNIPESDYTFECMIYIFQQYKNKVFKNLKSRMKELKWKEQTSDKLMYNLTDLNIVKYKIKNYCGKEVENAIDVLIDGYIWLYEKNLILENGVRDILKDEDAKKYELILNAFATLQEFMQSHMYLLGEYMG